MGWKVGIAKGGDFEDRENCPEGEHPAVLVALIDLGTQEEPDFNDRTKATLRHKIAAIWEVQGEQTSKGEPFYFGEEFNLSLNEKAKFRKVLEMGGKVKIDDDKMEDFDISQALGSRYLLTIEEAEGKKSRYTRLAKDGVAKLPKVMHSAIKDTVRPPFVWQIEDAKDSPISAYTWLPWLFGKKIADIVAKSVEMGGGGHGNTNGNGGGQKQPARATAATAAVASGDDDAASDDIPF